MKIFGIICHIIRVKAAKTYVKVIKHYAMKAYGGVDV
jgi:hypothetical protein